MQKHTIEAIDLELQAYISDLTREELKIEEGLELFATEKTMRISEFGNFLIFESFSKEL